MEICSYFLVLLHSFHLLCLCICFMNDVLVVSGLISQMLCYEHLMKAIAYYCDSKGFTSGPYSDPSTTHRSPDK